MKKFGAGVNDRDYAIARKFESAGLCSISQAIKAFQRDEDDRIAEWKRQLAEKTANTK